MMPRAQLETDLRQGYRILTRLYRQNDELTDSLLSAISALDCSIAELLEAIARLEDPGLEDRCIELKSKVALWKKVSLTLNKSVVIDCDCASMTDDKLHQTYAQLHILIKEAAVTNSQLARFESMMASDQEGVASMSNSLFKHLAAKMSEEAKAPEIAPSSAEIFVSGYKRSYYVMLGSRVEASTQTHSPGS